jgi:hypothetical protein
MVIKNNYFILIVFFMAEISGVSLAAEVAEDMSDETADDFWLLENFQPTKHAFWLYAGVDDESGGYYGLSTNLALSEDLSFDLSATQQNFNYKTDDISWGFSGRLSEQFNWGISRVFWGQKNSLEKIDTRISIHYFLDNFNSRLSYETGKVELFLKQPNILLLNSLLSDHRATELSLGYSWNSLYSELRYKQHDYQSRQPELVRRPQVFLLASSIGLQQARNLADKELSFLVGIQQHDMSYDILFSQVDSLFSKNSFRYTSLSLLKSLNTQWQLGVNVEIPLNEGLYSVGMSVGYLW